MGHWYDCDGKPHHTVIGANGKERPTTLRDARKMALWPSVTSIIDIPSSPMLIAYKENEIFKAVIQNPWKDNKDFDKWKRTCRDLAGEHSKAARDRGGELHNALEHFFNTGKVKKKDREFVTPVVDMIRDKFHGVDWIAEKSFCHMGLGYAGTIDLHSPEHKIVLDFKTKDKETVQDIKAYDNHHMQTAAYSVGLQWDEDNPGKEIDKEWGRYNLFISTQTEGDICLTESTDFDREWNMYLYLLKFWQVKNNYQPGD